MKRLASTEGIAGAAARHPIPTLLVWLVVLGAALYSAAGIGDVLTSDGDLLTTTESGTADALLDERFVGDGGPQLPAGVPVNGDAPTGNEEYVVVEALDGAGADLESFVAAVVSELRADERISVATSYLDGQPRYLSEDGRTAVVYVIGDGLAVLRHIEGLDDASRGFRVTTIGDDSIDHEFETLAEETLMRGELIGVSIALVILVIVFGAAVAAGVPIVLAVVAIIVSVGTTALIGQRFELSTFVVNMITMIGLAVGIDYSLFIVQRFREERAQGLEPIAAIEAAGRTASRAVLFSGMAVVIALSGMLFIPDTTFRSLGVGALTAVVAAVAAALTLLPAVLALLGDRVNWLSVPLLGRSRPANTAGGAWYAVARIVTRRPLVATVVVSGALLTIGSWYTQINLGENGITALPEDSSGRHAFEVLGSEFANSPNEAQIVIDAPDIDSAPVLAAIEQLEASLARDDSFGTPDYAASMSGDLGLVTVAMRGDYSSSEARAALGRLRGEYVPEAFDGVAEVFVTGDTAFDSDYVSVIERFTPFAFAYVLGLSFVLLLVTFRSIVVPLKAIAMNLLSVGAAYGLLVLVFQHGVGANLLGFQQTDVIEPWLPLFLFMILFGLSMDYHVFLLSRIKERYDLTGDNADAVAFGLSSTGALITGAALIMVAVFGGFAAGDLLMLQQAGFGLAVAVILDATVIRSVLVPASMALLGDRNWYFPSWLEWVPELHVEGSRASLDTAPAIVGAQVTDR